MWFTETIEFTGKARVYSMFFFKRISLGVVLTIMMIGVCGCMFTKQEMTKDDIISMYNEKYDDEFTYESSGNQLWNANYQEYILSSSRLNGAKITVCIYENGKIVDNYIPNKYKSNIEENVLSIAKSIYEDAIVINAPISYAKDVFSTQMTFEEYAALDAANIRCAILTNKSSESKEEDIERLRCVLKGKGILTDISIFYYNDGNLADVEIIDELHFDFYPKADMQGKMLLNEDYTINSLNWSK